MKKMDKYMRNNIRVKKSRKKKIAYMRRELRVTFTFIITNLLFIPTFLNLFLKIFLLINIVDCRSNQHRCVAYALIKFMKFNDLNEGII